MAAQNTHENIEEIIDLTELIEKGRIPEADTTASSPESAEEAALNTHMRSLNDSVQNVAAEAEIDDLLAQMEYKDEDGADAAATPASQTSSGDGSAESGMELTDSDTVSPSDFALVRMPDGHIVDPHEELHMPGIGEVDNLLNSLDIPPQPRPHEQSAPSPEDTDNAVDQMLGNLNGTSRPAPENASKAAGKSSHEDTAALDELLAAGTMPEPVISDELESLLRESAPSTNQQPQSKGKSPATFTAEPAAAKPAPGQVPDMMADQMAGQMPGQVADMMADQVAERGQTPSQPAAPATASLAQNAPSHDLNDDLDALLQSIMTDKPEHGPDKGMAKDAAQTQDEAEAQPAPASASDARVDDLSADLDQLLASIIQTEPQKPEPAPTAASGASQPTDADPAKAKDKLEFDLDALLAAADAEERNLASTVTTPEAPAAEQQPDPAEQAAGQPDPVEQVAQPNPVEQAEPEQAAQQAESAQAESEQDEQRAESEQAQSELAESELAEPALAAKPRQSGSLLPDVDLDDILAGNMVTASTRLVTSGHADNADTPATPGASASSDDAGQATVTADMTEILARLDLYAEKLQQADDRVQALEAAVAEARAEADQARAEADAAKTAAQQIQSDLDEKLTAAQTAHESLAQTAAEALHTAQNAAQNAEQAAASATAKQQEPDSTPSLEALFDADHPLHQRLMDCINTAAAEAAAEAAATAARQAAEQAVATAQSAMAQPNGAPAGHEDPALLESLLDDRMHAVKLTMHGASARLDAVESRLDELEPRFNERVEKAAASAAARILREEIGRLLENE